MSNQGPGLTIKPKPGFQSRRLLAKRVQEVGAGAELQILSPRGTNHMRLEVALIS